VFAKGHFSMAVNIPVEKLEDRIPGLQADKPVVFVCSTGARSGEAYHMVQDVRPSGMSCRIRTFWTSMPIFMNLPKTRPHRPPADKLKTGHRPGTCQMHPGRWADYFRRFSIWDSDDANGFLDMLPPA
jgi:hypothetical protein